MRTAVITIAHGRHDHLAAQQAALARSDRAPDVRVVVAMDDHALRAEAEVVHVDRVDGALPLAAARNAGVARARELGAELLVLLDVDCLPDPVLLDRYASAAAQVGGLLCGPVGYLPAAPAGGYPVTGLRELARVHEARPVPADGEVVTADDPDLFWSLSFAVSARDWDRIGGFCEDYVGYGGEDTDFARVALVAGLGLGWVGAPRAFHQWHPVSRPPVEHVEDIVRNARIFHARWGEWPMRGWLEAFEERGLVHRTRVGGWALGDRSAGE